VTTLKIKIETGSDFTSLLKEGNKIVRIAFNLCKKKKLSKKEIYHYIKNNYNYDDKLVDCATLEHFIIEAIGIYKSSVELKREKTTFGTKKEWGRYHSKLITLDDFKNIKNTNPLLFVGRGTEIFGNRRFKLKIEDGVIIFKQAFRNHHILKLKTTNSRLKMLQKLQSLVLNKVTRTPITYRINNEYLWISFDEKVLKEYDHKPIENRIASLDLNPNYIALVIQDYKKDKPKLIHKKIYNLSKLNNHPNNNKLKFETQEVSKSICETIKHYKCEILGLEKLRMQAKDHKNGRRFNNLVNGVWKLDSLVKNIQKRLNILGINHQEILPQYSTTVGCLLNPDEVDSVCSALEMNRRMYVFNNKFLKKNERFSSVDVMFPTLDYKTIKERWNSILGDYNPKNVGFVAIHKYLKKQKKLSKLRFLFKDYDFSLWSCFRHKSDKSLILSCCC
jgi:hypothetical protein